jgi:hypothetical protein
MILRAVFRYALIVISRKILPQIFRVNSLRGTVNQGDSTALLCFFDAWKPVNRFSRNVRVYSHETIQDGKLIERRNRAIKNGG